MKSLATFLLATVAGAGLAMFVAMFVALVAGSVQAFVLLGLGVALVCAVLIPLHDVQVALAARERR